MNLLLHACCAPCAALCVKSLREEGISHSLFWYNPNIHPYTEYEARRGCLAEFCCKEKLKLERHDEYGLRPFLSAVFNTMDNRCEICYSLRLEKTASFAAENGYQAFSTSLLISPYQKHEELKCAGEAAASKHGVSFLYRDFRPLFRESRENARAMGLYMQKYCGCVFSEEERYLKKDNKKHAHKEMR
jgi:predicted adenine nucleotide alpha hydrolase (AANH) superfamily ATPase